MVILQSTANDSEAVLLPGGRVCDLARDPVHGGGGKAPGGTKNGSLVGELGFLGKRRLELGSRLRNLRENDWKERKILSVVGKGRWTSWDVRVGASHRPQTPRGILYVADGWG